MPSLFEPIAGAGAWQHSNPPMLSMLPLIATLESIETAGGLPALRARSVRLTAYLEALLKESRFYRPPGTKPASEHELTFTILTPDREGERGAQLSLAVLEGAGETKGVMVRVFDGLQRRGVLGDERKPDVIRLSCVLHPKIFVSSIFLTSSPQTDRSRSTRLSRRFGCQPNSLRRPSRRRRRARGCSAVCNARHVSCSIQRSPGRGGLRRAAVEPLCEVVVSEPSNTTRQPYRPWRWLRSYPHRRRRFLAPT